MKQELIKLEEKMMSRFNELKTLEELNEFKVYYMGKKGPIQELLAGLRDLSSDEKKEFGLDLNRFTSNMNGLMDELRRKFEEEAMYFKMKLDAIDITLPSTNINVGGIHPITKVVNEIEELFISMGYDVVTGPEIELDLFNFERLNLPKGHPARDAQDSFYITDETLLRTHTSPVQARAMEANREKGPIRIICPGKTYRRDDDDATHSHQFTQIEGLVIGEGLSVAHLKGTLEVFAQKMFGENTNVRFRPSFFPFTEPSLEVDVTCFKCDGKGCNLCKGTGWIEILGSGMVHPNVLRMSGYDPDKYTGFAFGIGPERVAMLKYGINDIRAFYINDLRFLKDFNRVEGGEIHEGK